MEKIYGINDAARLIDVSLGTLLERDKSGEMVAHRKSNGEMYYTNDQIRDAIEKNSNGDRYYVIENRNIGSVGRPEFVEKILFVGTKEQCVEYEDSQRKKYKDTILVDCYVESELERKKKMMVTDYWRSLPDKEKKETITVNGKTYYKAIYNYLNGEDNEHKE